MSAERSEVERAATLLAAATERATEARAHLRHAEEGCLASGHAPHLVEWMREARLAYQLADRLAFEAREGLRRAELAALEEDRYQPAVGKGRKRR